MCNWSQLVIFDLPVGFCQHAGITPKIAGLTAIPIPNLKGGCWCRRCYDIPGGKSSDSVHSYGKCFEECLWNPTNQETKEGKLWLSELVSAVSKKITKVALKSLNHLQVKLKTPDIDPFLHSTICSTIGSENDICPMDPVRVHSTNAYIYVYIYTVYTHWKDFRTCWMMCVQTVSMLQGSNVQPTWPPNVIGQPGVCKDWIARDLSHSSSSCDCLCLDNSYCLVK